MTRKHYLIVFVVVVAAFLLGLQVGRRIKYSDALTIWNKAYTEGIDTYEKELRKVIGQRKGQAALRRTGTD